MTVAPLGRSRSLKVADFDTDRCNSVTRLSENLYECLTLYSAEVSTGYILPSRSNLHF